MYVDWSFLECPGLFNVTAHFQFMRRVDRKQSTSGYCNLFNEHRREYTVDTSTMDEEDSTTVIKQMNRRSFFGMSNNSNRHNFTSVTVAWSSIPVCKVETVMCLPGVLTLQYMFCLDPWIRHSAPSKEENKKDTAKILVSRFIDWAKFFHGTKYNRTTTTKWPRAWF